MINAKTELDLLREQLESAQTDLLAYSKYQGQSPVIDANIRHKRAQVEQLQARVLEMEQEEEKEKGRQMSLFEK